MSTQFLKLLGHLPKTYKLIWQAAPRWTTAWVVVLIVQGLVPAATVYLTGPLVDSLVSAIEASGSWTAVRETLSLALVMGGILLLSELLKGAGDWIRTAQTEYISDHIKQIVHEKSMTVDMVYYESADFYDRLSRVQGDSSSRPLNLLESSGSLMQNSITLIALATILLPYGFWLPLALLVSVFPAFFVILRYNQTHHQWWEETTPDRRWIRYYDVMLTSRSTAAEVRAFATGSHFQNAYQRLRGKLRDEHLKLIRSRGISGLVASTMAIIITGLAMGWMVWRAIQGSISIGSLARFYQAFNQGQSLMRLLLRQVGQMYSNNLFLGNLFEFLALEPNLEEPQHPRPVPTQLQEGITFHQVSFHYPGSKKKVLSNFDLTLPANKMVAIVGPNGAGKSTLSRLLVRFFDPQSGRVELDGIDLRQFSSPELRKVMTILFQVPLNYHGTVSENIAYGNIHIPMRPESIQAAANAAGVDEIINRLPNGFDTLLGKYYANGLDLSGGELQRLALARAFYKQAPIIILDEPTSFMDSWAEIAWLARSRKLVHGRTALIITHRFTTAMQADIIHVMEAGEIIESGTHAELLALDGRYAASWQAQMHSAETKREPELSSNGYIPD